MADVTQQDQRDLPDHGPLWRLPIQDRGASKAEQIVAALRAAIVMLRFKPGLMLSEQDVATRFEVSRQPVREAFIRLAASGLVEVRPQRGTFVGRISVSAIADAHFVREAVEVAIARRAAKRAGEADLAALEDELRLQWQAERAGDADLFFHLDEQFHRRLTAVAGLPNAWRVFEDAKAQLDRTRYLTLLDERCVRDRILQHEAIVEAISLHRPALAAAAMKQHLAGLMRALPRLATERPELFMKSS